MVFKFLKKKIERNFLYFYKKYFLNPTLRCVLPYFYVNFKDAYLTTIKLMKQKRLIGLNDIFNFFLIRSFFSLTYFRNQIGIRESNDIIEDKNFTYPLKKNSILKDIHLKGHSDVFKLKESLKDNLLLEILTNLEDSKIIYNDTNSKFKKLNFVNKREIDEYLKINDIHLIKSKLDLTKTIFLKKIFLGNFFIELAKDYLNDDKISVHTSFFISNTKNLSSPILGAQKYHHDVDFKKFFKVFIYFSDVLDSDNGAHTFIPYSHTKKNIKNYLASGFDTSQIEKDYAFKKIFLGEEGTVFMEDTFGIHKGLPVIKGTRLALIIEFGKGHCQVDKNPQYI